MSRVVNEALMKLFGKSIKLIADRHQKSCREIFLYNFIQQESFYYREFKCCSTLHSESKMDDYYCSMVTIWVSFENIHFEPVLWLPPWNFACVMDEPHSFYSISPKKVFWHIGSNTRRGGRRLLFRMHSGSSVIALTFFWLCHCTSLASIYKEEKKINCVNRENFRIFTRYAQRPIQIPKIIAIKRRHDR